MRSAPLPGQAPMGEVTLQLRAGELLMVQVEPGNEQLPLTDAALGLTPPERGRTLFMGTDWQDAAPDTALEMRARIGRVFDHSGWISNLDVIENITLAQRHHTRRPIAEINAEAQQMARQFGLAGVPAGRPANVPRRDLRRAEWAPGWEVRRWSAWNARVRASPMNTFQVWPTPSTAYAARRSCSLDN